MTTPRKYKIGDDVTVPSDFCPGCMQRLDPTAGRIVGMVRDGDQSALFEDTPGPFYSVWVDHEHNSGGHLIYAESELMTNEAAGLRPSHP